MSKKSRNTQTREPVLPVAQPQHMTFEQAMQMASQHQAAGRLQPAEVLLRQILQTHPNQPYAMHLLGIIAHQVGKTEVALDYIGKAIAIDKNNVQFLSNYTEMCRQAGHLDEAIKHGELAVTLAPDAYGAHSNLGIAYYDNEQFDLAEKHQQIALELKPDLPPSLNNMGSICRERKDMEAAIQYYRKAAAADPDYTEPLNNLGAVLTQEDRAQEAVSILEKALQLNPDYCDALCNLGFAQNALEHYDRAKPVFLRSLQLRPAYTEAHLGLVRIFQESDDLEQAEQAAKNAIHFDPEKADCYGSLGQVYSRMGHFDKSEANFDKALGLDPDLGSALLGKGNLYMEAGRLKEAEDLFVRSLETDDDQLASRFYLAQIKKTKKGDENLAALAEEAKNIHQLSDGKSVYLHFALGKCYDDIKEYDSAFPHFLKGCQLKRVKNAYDHAAKMDIFDTIMRGLDKPRIEQMQGHGNDSNTPIFILGMPRSGTTLTEQIIASHPDVYGAGELYDLMNIGSRSTTTDNADKPFGDNFKNLNAEHIAVWGEAYVKGLRERAPDFPRITDKMPANFLLIGLIHLMLPNARIIHVQRNPLDTCLSCFTRLFHNGQDHTYNLQELGSYYRKYVQMMEHWRNVLPAGAFLELEYEKLVTDNETQTRLLIDYCDLEWDDRCLESYKTKRTIKTSSVTQVRQPVYTSSVERWRSYEKYLGPLVDALGDVLDPSPSAGGSGNLQPEH